VSKMIGEAWRHAKAIGSVPGAASSLAALLPANAPGVVHGEPTQVADQIAELLAAHRAWQRFPTSKTA